MSECGEETWQCSKHGSALAPQCLLELVDGLEARVIELEAKTIEAARQCAKVCERLIWAMKELRKFPPKTGPAFSDMAQAIDFLRDIEARLKEREL